MIDVVMELLYWQADGDGLPYTVEVDSSKDVPFLEQIEGLHFDWDVGFQVAFGYQLPHDAWTVGGKFTLFHTHTDAHKEGYPLWSVGDAVVDEAQAHWRLHLGLLDGFLGKRWAVSDCLLMGVQLGLKAACVRQKFQLTYGQEVQLSMKNKFAGLGPAIGLDSEWLMARAFSLFGQCVFAIEFGEFYLHQAEWERDLDRVGIHSEFWNSVPIAEMTCGVRWSCSKSWTIELAWDQVMLWGQNQWIHFTGNYLSSQGTLNLHGIRGGLIWSF